MKEPGSGTAPRGWRGPEITPLRVALLTAAVTVPTSVLATLLCVGRSVGPGAAPVARRAEPAGEPPGPSAPPAQERPVTREGPVARTVVAPPIPRLAVPWAAGAERAATADLDGDGIDEIALGGADLAIFASDGRELARATEDGSVHLLEGGQGAIHAAWGWSRAWPSTTARVVRYRLQAGALISDTVATPDIDKGRISSLVPLDGEVLVAWTVAPYTVGLFRAVPDLAGWTLAPWVEERTAAAFAVADFDHDGEDDLLIGRAYGDAVGSDGDAWLLRASGERVKIPTIRGVRATTAADTDGDGRPEMVLADGWHKDYGRLARAQVRVARWTDTGVESTFVDASPGDYDVRRLIAEDLDGDGRDEIVVVTDERLRVVDWDGETWSAWEAAVGVADAAVVHGGAGERPRLLVVGREPVLLGPLP